MLSIMPLITNNPGAEIPAASANSSSPARPLYRDRSGARVRGVAKNTKKCHWSGHRCSPCCRGPGSCAGCGHHKTPHTQEHPILPSPSALPSLYRLYWSSHTFLTYSVSLCRSPRASRTPARRRSRFAFRPPRSARGRRDPPSRSCPQFSRSPSRSCASAPASRRAPSRAGRPSSAPSSARAGLRKASSARCFPRAATHNKASTKRQQKEHAWGNSNGRQDSTAERR